jgi:hypothetical protein
VKEIPKDFGKKYMQLLDTMVEIMLKEEQKEEQEELTMRELTEMNLFYQSKFQNALMTYSCYAFQRALYRAQHRRYRRRHRDQVAGSTKCLQ